MDLIEFRGFVDKTWDVNEFYGQVAQIVCEDNNNNSSYAWFCVDEFWMDYDTTATPSGYVSSKPVLVNKKADQPDEFVLNQNAPNPFNPETTISYSLPRATEVQLIIYNVLGQKVRTLVNTAKPAGEYQVIWDSRDDWGREVSSGVYLYHFIAGEFVDTRKMLILK